MTRYLLLSAHVISEETVMGNVDYRTMIVFHGVFQFLDAGQIKMIWSARLESVFADHLINIELTGFCFLPAAQPLYGHLAVSYRVE